MNIRAHQHPPMSMLMLPFFQPLQSQLLKERQNIDDIVKQHVVFESIFHQEIISLFKILIVIIVKGLGVGNYTRNPWSTGDEHNG